MAFHPRPQVVNPLLGIYFGIFLAGLVAIVMLILILEQLGASDVALRRLLLAGLLALLAGIGAIGYCATPREFFLSGRRVPASLNGLVIALVSLGGTGLTAMTGALFLVGYDALCLLLGVLAGLVVMAILVAPYFRKFGASTVPGFLGARFDSMAARLTASGVAAVPLLLLLIAEIKVAAAAAGWLVQGSEGTAFALVTVALVAILVPGGVRSLSWSSAAQAIAALLAILVPAAIIASLETYLPLAQLSHGPVMRAVGRLEAVHAVATPIATPLLIELPNQELQPISGRFATPFGSVGPAAFVLVVLAMMAGIAGHPGLLARTATTPTVYETRKSLGWAVFVAGVLITTMSAFAVLQREFLMTTLLDTPPARLSALLKPLIDIGLMGLDGQARPGSVQAILYRRDGVLMTLPIQLGFPWGIVHLVAAGILAAALAAAGACLVQLGTIVGEDIVNGPSSELVAPSTRLNVVRGAVVLLAVLAGWLARHLPGDPLELALVSLSVSGSALFPVLVLAVWWKRTNAWGALAGLSTGLALAMLSVLGHAVEAVALPPVLGAAVAGSAATVAAIVATRLTPRPSRHVLELVRDLRVPNGEAVQDREARLSVQRERQARSG